MIPQTHKIITEITIDYLTMPFPVNMQDSIKIQKRNFSFNPVLWTQTESVHYKNFAALLLFKTIHLNNSTSNECTDCLVKQNKKKKKKKTQIGRRNCKTSQALTSFYKRVKKYKENPIIERYVKDNTYLFSHQSLIITMKSSSMQGKIKVLFFCSVQLLHVISIFVVIERMKRVWQPRLEIRAKTVKKTGARIQSFIVPSECGHPGDRYADFFFDRLS